jgi:hypothetical protein
MSSIIALIQGEMDMIRNHKNVYRTADEAVPLFDLGGLPTGLTVPVPLKKVDTFFTTSIVINF